MEELITQFEQTGPCVVDIDKVATAWNDHFSISQYDENYRLIQQIELFKEPAYKITISKSQAFEIIEKVKLLPIRCTFLALATTWRTSSNIISEKNRLEKILDDKTGKATSEEIRVLKSIISSYETSLSKQV